jgi:hypothetical protein
MDVSRFGEDSGTISVLVSIPLMPGDKFYFSGISSTLRTYLFRQCTNEAGGSDLGV